MFIDETVQNTQDGLNLNILGFHPTTMFNLFMPSGFAYFNSLDKFISYVRGVWLVLLLSCFIEIPELNANNVDPDQMPPSAANDLGLHCSPMSLPWDASLIWFKTNHKAALEYGKELTCLNN